MTDTSSGANRPDLRIGDADRSRVADLLDDAYADGRLDRAEHDERMAQALTARTVADISRLVRDLGPLDAVLPQPGSPSGSSLVSPASSVPIVAGQQNDRIVTILGDVSRGAGSVLAVRTEIVSGLGDVRLDLTSMSLAAHDVVIDIKSALGDVKIMVPAGIRVIDQTGRFLGDSKFEGLAPTAPDAPTITLTGFLALGDVKVYGPEYKSFAKKLRRWFGQP